MRGLRHAVKLVRYPELPAGVARIIGGKRMNFKKIAATLLAAVMSVSLAACNSADVKWIAKADGEEVPSGVYLVHLINAYSEAESKVEDKEKKVLTQTVDGTPAAQWITEQADKNFQRYIAIEKKAKEQNVTISDVENSFVMQQAQYQWQFMEGIYTQNGVSQDSMILTLQNGYKESLLFNAQYGENGVTPISQEELLKEFQSNYYKAMYITISLVDNNNQPKDEAGKKVVTDKANEILAKATADGANYSDVILEYEKSQAEAKGDDSTIHAHDASSHVSFIGKENESYTAEFKAEIDKMQIGEVKVITSGNVVYILQRLANDVPEDLSNSRSEIMTKLKGTEFDESIDALAASTVVEYNTKAKSLYTPAKLKMDVKATA